MEDNQTARRRDRAVAWFFDHGAICFFGVILMFLSLENNYDTIDVDNLFNRKLPLFFVIVAVYICKDIYKGTSLGKWLSGIAVRDNKNFRKTPSIIKLMIRNLFIALWPLEILVLLFNPKKQRIGDIVAGTVVVRVAPPSFNREKYFVLGSIFIVGILSFLYSGHIFTTRTSAYKVVVAAIKNNRDLQEKTGGVAGFGWLPTFNGSFGQYTGDVDLSTKVYFINGEKLDIMVHLKKQNENKWTITSPAFLTEVSGTHTNKSSANSTPAL